MKLNEGRVGDVDDAVEVHVTEDVFSGREVVVGRKLGVDLRAAVAEHCFHTFALILRLGVVDVPVVVIRLGNQIGEGLLENIKVNRRVALADHIKDQMYNGNGGSVCFHKKLGVIAVAEIETRLTVAVVEVCDNGFRNGAEGVVIILVHVGLLAETQDGGIVAERVLTVDDAVLRRFQIVIYHYLSGDDTIRIADGGVIVKKVGLGTDNQCRACLRACRLSRKSQTADTRDDEQHQSRHHCNCFVFHRETPSC